MLVCKSCNRRASAKFRVSLPSNLCRTCYQREWHQKSPIYRRARQLHMNAISRSRKRGWPKPDFGAVWIMKKIQAGVCEATGIKFYIDTSGNHPFAPSLDRVNNNGPYTKDNVQVVVYMYNVCKGPYRHEDVLFFCERMVQHGKDSSVAT